MTQRAAIARAAIMNGPAITILRGLPVPQLAGLLMLMLGVALTEGVGILALVPMLALLGQAASALPSWAEPFARLVDLPMLLVFFVALVAGRAALQFALSLAQQRAQLKLIDRWRHEVFAALVRANWRTLSAMRRSDHVSLIVTSIDRLGYGFSNLLQIIAMAVTLGAIWIVALWLAPALAAVAVVGGLIVIAGFIPLKRKAHRLGVALGQRYAAVQGSLDESLRAMRLIKSHGREAAAIATMQGGMTELRSAQIAFHKAASRSRALLHVGAAILLATIIALASARDVPTSVLLPLIVLFGRSVPLLDALQQGTQQWAHSAPALAEAQAVLDTARAGAEPPVGDALPVVPRQSIALDNATIDHDGRHRPAVDAITLTLPVATTTALVGPSGAGKSTLADLFGGLLEPDGGDLVVDGKRLRGEGTVHWRRSVAYVHQEPVLFPASIRENMLWAEPDASDPQIETALRDAAAGFVFDLPSGVDTFVGDAGCQLSGGERQRIALARALLRDPALLILDEATSALDAASEAAIADAIGRMKGVRTVLIVAHRGMLTDLADRIVHMRDGRIEHVENRRKVVA
ncbi:ABC transporter ATP-binding protein [Croceicoccus ponticola]|uniref:ABC transporter ATP-binding protein n=1 Tax=Croceicoccus ponticola TaxID=2217664 RepID=UPI0013E30725|nr:ABC transporter ATP-binding protein [Croceicoccus ponticola]